MIYPIDILEITALVLLAICILTIIGISIVDRIDYHYSKKRGEI